MRVLVVGGTGTAGRPTVEELARRGHQVRVLSRSGRGVAGADGVRGDVATGSGLAEAMDGVGAVVDVSNITTLSEKVATPFFTEAARRLVAAGGAADGRGGVVLGFSRVGLGA